MRAVETVDEAVGRVVPVAMENGYVLITSDHGNVEKMICNMSIFRLRLIQLAMCF